MMEKDCEELALCLRRRIGNNNRTGKEDSRNQDKVPSVKSQHGYVFISLIFLIYIQFKYFYLDIHILTKVKKCFHIFEL